MVPGKAEEGASLVWLATDDNAARGRLDTASLTAHLPGALSSTASPGLSVRGQRRINLADPGEYPAADVYRVGEAGVLDDREAFG